MEAVAEVAEVAPVPMAVELVVLIPPVHQGHPTRAVEVAARAMHLVVGMAVPEL